MSVALPKRPEPTFAPKRLSLNVPSKPRIINNNITLVDDSMVSESFGNLEFHSDSFIALPQTNRRCVTDPYAYVYAHAQAAEIGPTLTSHNPIGTANTQSPQKSIHSRRSSISRQSSGSPPFPRKQGGWNNDLKSLESQYHRFMSRTGIHKANVLRLGLLPFLRQFQPEAEPFTQEESSRCIRVLSKWWAGLLCALRDRDRPISGSDRSAYLEAISAIVARNEWRNVENQASFKFYLEDTLKFVTSKLSVKTVPLTLDVFAGKILAYAFFYEPGVAQFLLHHLKTSESDASRIIKASFSNDSDTQKFTTLDGAVTFVSPFFPYHLKNLIGSSKVSKSLQCPSIPELNGPWLFRWTSFNSDVFYSFLKHYYTIISCQLPPGLPLNAHMASPGLLIIHSFLLNMLDSVVHPRKPK